MACASAGTSATPGTYDQISDAVKNFDTTQEWFDSYPGEARRLKIPQLFAMPTTRRSRNPPSNTWATLLLKPLPRKKHHLDNSATRFAGRASTAKAGAIPGLKAVVKPMAVS